MSSALLLKSVLEILNNYRPGQPNWKFLLWKFHSVEGILAIFLPLEVGFCWVQKAKICCLNNFEAFELWFLEKIDVWKCQKIPQIQNSDLQKWPKMAIYWASKWPKLISPKIWVREKIWNFQIRLPRPVLKTICTLTLYIPTNCSLLKISQNGPTDQPIFSRPSIRSNWVLTPSSNI